jgi:hypothetical protein
MSEVFNKNSVFTRLDYGFDSHSLLTSTLMEITSSIINDLQSFVRHKIFPTSMVVVLDYIYIGMVFYILLRQVDFGVFLIVAVRRIILTIFVRTAKYSTMVIHTLISSTTSTRLSDLFSLK